MKTLGNLQKPLKIDLNSHEPAQTWKYLHKFITQIQIQPKSYKLT